MSAVFYLAAGFGLGVVLMLLAILWTWVAPRFRRVVTPADVAAVAPRFPLSYFADQLNDPTFDPKEFLDVSKALFESFHRGVEKGKLDAVRPFMTDELYLKHADAIRKRDLRAQRAVMKSFKLHRIAIRSAISIRSRDSITIRALASCADYEIDSNGRVFGDKRVRAWEEDWLFERGKGPESKLAEIWMITSITAVDRNRFRAGEHVARKERNDDFWAGRSPRATR